MLYSEFLIGTGAADNEYTMAEYNRINAIYNDDNNMEKADAYKLYQQPPQWVRDLLARAAEYKAEMIAARGQVQALQEENRTLRDDFASVEYELDLISRHAKIAHDIAGRN